MRYNHLTPSERDQLYVLRVTEIGHWEKDTVIGANHEGVMVTCVDKASKYLLTELVKNKTVE